MKSLLSVLFLSGVSLAQEGPWTAFVNKGQLDASESAFEVTKPGSADDIAIQANGGRFWLGKPASAYCPADVDKLDCSAFKDSSNQTIFVGGNDFGDSPVGLRVVVPGGQQVYIAPDGALGYTLPHSAAMPNGSSVAVFGRAPLTAGGRELVLWTSLGDFQACPAAKEYQIFVRNQAFEREDCTLIVVKTRASNGTVWQY